MNFDIMINSYLWTQQAQDHFGAVTANNPVIAEKLAQWVCFGESGSKDLPLLKLSALIAIFGEASRANAANAEPEAFDLLVLSSQTIWTRLQEWAQSDPHAIVAHQALVRWKPPSLEDPLIVSRGSIPILVKLLEFLLMIEIDDEPDFASEWLAACEMVIKPAPDQRLGPAIKDLVKLASAAMYKYRRHHLNLYGAEFAYRSLALFLSDNGFANAYRQVGDEALLWFWEACPADQFRDFSTVLNALVALCADQNSSSDARQLATGQSVKMLDNGDEVAAVDTISSEQLAYLPSQSLGEQYQDSIGAINDNTLPLVSKNDLNRLVLWSRYEPLWSSQMLSVVRAVAFAPVSNGLTAMQQTGKSRLSLKDRLSCVEALPYADLQGNLDMLGAKISDAILEILSILDPTNEQLTPQIVEERAKARQRSRSKGYMGGEDLIKERASEVWADFLGLQEAIRRILRAQKPLGLPSSSQQFEADKFRFTKKFTALYGEEKSL